MEEIEVAAGCAGRRAADRRRARRRVHRRRPPHRRRVPAQPAGETVLRAGDIAHRARHAAHAGAARGAVRAPARGATGMTAPPTDLRDARRRRGRRRGRRRRRRRADARAPAPGRARRLRDERGDAARPALRRAAARRRRRAWPRRSPSSLGDDADRVEVAGPGFLNLLPVRRLVRARARRRASRRATASAAAAPRRRERVIVEFVWPTRPARSTSAGARNAAYGDALARILAFHGHAVEREFYVNDSRHADRAASASRSAPARAARSRPRTATRATTSRELAAEIQGAAELDRRRARAARRRDDGRAHPRRTLARFGVVFDVWFSERDAARGQPVGDRARRSSGLDASRATTYRARRRAVAAHDRVRRRQGPRDRALDGRARPTSPPTSPTTRDKRERGFDLLIDVLGRRPPRLRRRGCRRRSRRSAATPAGSSSRSCSSCTSSSGGERAKMSKRRGEFVTLDDLIDEIGVDAARWFMLAALARHDDRPRPRPRARAVQREPRLLRAVRPRADRVGARARPARSASPRRSRARPAPRAASCIPSERALVKKLLDFPAEVGGGRRPPRAAPHRRLRAGARAGVHAPSTATARSSAPSRRRWSLPPAPLRRGAAHDRPRARPARASPRPTRCERAPSGGRGAVSGAPRTSGCAALYACTTL